MCVAKFYFICMNRPYRTVFELLNTLALSFFGQNFRVDNIFNIQKKSDNKKIFELISLYIKMIPA